MPKEIVTTLECVASQSMRKGDAVFITGMSKPKWWQFWKKPMPVVKKCIITELTNGSN